MSKNTGNSTIIGISLFTYGKQRWEEISCSHKYNSLTLNLIVCQKRTLNPGRISLQKRKAQHRRKRIQRKNYAKTKKQRARLTAGFLFALVGVLQKGVRRCCVFTHRRDKLCVGKAGRQETNSKACPVFSGSYR
jgi:hypothetical protein